jgi:transcriptional antiterminator NusG
VNNPYEFRVGDRVMVRGGNFENFEGEVQEIDYATGRITVSINIFGRITRVEVEHCEKLDPSQHG